MDKYVHTLKDEVRKKTEDLKKKDEELTKERSERKSVEKEVGDSLTKIKKVRYIPASLVCLWLLTSCRNCWKLYTAESPL